MGRNNEMTGKKSRQYIQAEYTMSREYRDNFNTFFRILDRETRKWGADEGYKMNERTWNALFYRAWNLNNGETLWLSPFLYDLLSECRLVNTPRGTTRFDYSPLVELLEERWAELTDDDPETSDVDYRYGGWIRTTCDYE